MKNSNRIFFIFITLCLIMPFCRMATAGVATTYDELNLVTYQSGQDIVGYYRAHEPPFSCEFLFMANRDHGVKSADGTEALQMKTFDFVPYKNTFSYAQRDPRAEIGGTLYLRDNEIALKTDHPHGGCQSAAGLFNAAPGERGGSQYSATKRFDAVGIAVSVEKSYFYEKPGIGRRRQYILPGDLVTLLSRRNGYSYARYVNPDMAIDETDSRKVVSGWLRNSDLANPFPASPAIELMRSSKKERRDND
ncbi:hypothetical protein NE850_01665 [Paraburkholderia sp. USG1]|uniref:hypothetical protein n=1 Tax=Paraburkholderia sp. USG1 TaxID=2952268 RepID=UPI0028677392|nr:hypothetical protein [Paraburkholderia sp. USG1]MDR8395032.1 hypothetical protein [Paraburkholderia sp. USG1]